MKTLLLLLLLAAPLPGFEITVGWTGSMRPALRGGERLECHLDVPYEDLKPGDIVLFKSYFRPAFHQDQPIIHRLVRKTPRGWITKGDNNERCDVGLMTESLYIGVVYLNERKS